MKDPIIENRIASAERDLAQLEMAWGPVSTKLLPLILNLADLQFALGRFACAERLYTRYLNIVCKEFGHADLRAAHGLQLMGEVCEAQGLYSEAERLYLSELEVRQKLKRCDRDLIDVRTRLLSFYRLQEEEFKARIIQRQLLASLDDVPPDSRPVRPAWSGN